MEKLFWQEIKVVRGVKIPDLHPTTWAIDLVDTSNMYPRDATVC
jgi:hypothetical protein